MALITVFVEVAISYYIIYFLTLMLAPTRKEIQAKNTKLDSMRKVPLKTLEQQKEFINTKYPKKKFKILPFIFHTASFILMFLVVQYIFKKSGIEFSFLAGLAVIIAMILGINFILKPYRLQNTDLDSMLKW